MERLLTITSVIIAVLLGSMPPAQAQRRVTPVNTPATRTQPKNDARADSARALQQRRDRSIHFHDENGNVIMVDTLTGVEWTDSTLLPRAPRMKYPLLHSITVGANLSDPLLRAFGTHYGGGEVSVAVSLHNRYVPVFEAGFGSAHKTPDHGNFTYRSGAAPYFRLGIDYNFLYNSNPDYQFYAGLRYGFSPFHFQIDDITVENNYWNENISTAIPSASVTAGWFEFCLGLRVRVAGPVSLGWTAKFHSIMHRTHPAAGDAWYIPGFGTATSKVGASFSIYYTLPYPRHRKNVSSPNDDINDNGMRTSVISPP